MAIAYQTGATRTATNHNFVSSWDALSVDSDTRLTQAFGRQKFIGILDYYGLRAPVHNMSYRHYEELRNYPKIKATSPGGAAGAAVTFTLDASSTYTYGQNFDPYDTNVTATKVSHPVRVGETLLIRPGSGTISADTYIKALVISVDPGAGEFVAQPFDSAESIPVIGSAQEIVIFGSLYGEASNRPEAASVRRIRKDYNIATHKETKRYSNIVQCEKKWFKNPSTGSFYFRIVGEEDILDIHLNKKEAFYLMGDKLSNTPMENVFADNETPIQGYRGLIPSILAEGNELNYAAVTGLTLQDLRNHTIVMDAQKASKNNLFAVGIGLSSQLDEELGDRFKNGAVTYGNFRGGANKEVSLDFQRIEINGYWLNKNILDIMNETQLFGAEGYTFRDEGMILPMDMVTDGRGNKVPTMRTRYLEKDGVSQEMVTSYFNGREQGDTGQDFEEVRYLSYCGPEFFALNKFSYVKKA